MKKKYRKYKKKYQILKSNISGTLLNGGAKGTLLNGGDCDPLPNSEEEDFVSRENLLDLYPDAKGTFWRKNYNTK
jgi:hypothetical protein